MSLADVFFETPTVQLLVPFSSSGGMSRERCAAHSTFATDVARELNQKPTIDARACADACLPLTFGERSGDNATANESAGNPVFHG